MVPPVQPYDERLTAPRSWWLICALVGVAGALMLLPLGTLPALGGLVGAGALAAMLVSAYGALRVRVVADALIAGDARIPLSVLGTAHPLDPEETRAWRSYRADPRAHLVLRSYVPTAVRVEVTDPTDPTPYVYISTREPQRLAAALDAARQHSSADTGCTAD